MAPGGAGLQAFFAVVWCIIQTPTIANDGGGAPPPLAVIQLTRRCNTQDCTASFNCILQKVPAYSIMGIALRFWEAESPSSQRSLVLYANGTIQATWDARVANVEQLWPGPFARLKEFTVGADIRLLYGFMSVRFMRDKWSYPEAQFILSSGTLGENVHMDMIFYVRARDILTRRMLTCCPPDHEPSPAPLGHSRRWSSSSVGWASLAVMVLPPPNSATTHMVYHGPGFPFQLKLDIITHNQYRHRSEDCWKLSFTNMTAGAILRKWKHLWIQKPLLAFLLFRGGDITLCATGRSAQMANKSYMLEEDYFHLQPAFEPPSPMNVVPPALVMQNQEREDWKSSCPPAMMCINPRSTREPGRFRNQAEVHHHLKTQEHQAALARSLLRRQPQTSGGGGEPETTRTIQIQYQQQKKGHRPPPGLVLEHTTTRAASTGPGRKKRQTEPATEPAVPSSPPPRAPRKRRRPNMAIALEP